MGAADLYRASPSIGEHRAVAARVTALETGPPPGGAGLVYDQTLRTASFTAAADTSYRVSTDTGDVTVTLPDGGAGATVEVRRVDNPASGHLGRAYFARINHPDGSLARWVWGDETVQAVHTGVAWVVEGGDPTMRVVRPYVLPAAERTQDRTVEGVPSRYGWIRYPGARMVADLKTVDALTVTRPAGTGSTAATATDGALRGSFARFEVAAATTPTAQTLQATVPLTTPVNLTTHALRAMTRSEISTAFGAAYQIHVSSDGFATNDYHRYSVDKSKTWTGSWEYVGTASYEAVGAGANLAAINAVRFHVSRSVAGLSIRLDVDHLQTYPLYTGVPIICLTFDDGSVDHLRTIAPELSKRGLVGIGYFNVASMLLNGEGARALQEQYGWEFAAHATSTYDHNDTKTGIGFRGDLELASRARKAFGVADAAHWAFYSGQSTGIPSDPDTRQAVAQRFLTSRWWVNGDPGFRDTLPPISPHGLRGYGYQTGDDTSGAAMKAYVDSVVAGPGRFGLVTFHLTSMNVGVTELFDHLQTLHDAGLVRVVTLSDAIGPYLAGAAPRGGGSVTYETVPPGSTFTIDRSGGAWPARPTTRTDVIIRWRGVAPAPSLVTSGTAGMYASDEFVEELP